MEYRIEKGILYRDGIPVFALGASYYPSFLPSKYQVPESGDRIGEMKKDLRKMKEAGLNFFRTAALAEIKSENGAVSTKSEFTDLMAEEAAFVGLAASIRLNGYFVNISENENYEFINHKGEAMKKDWNVFMQSSLHHKGFNADNIAATKALARHFDKYSSVVSYQIYNEPHYPFNGVFDYHPDAVRAYKSRLVEEGIITEGEAADYEIPRSRPTEAEDIDGWISWRMFSMLSMCRFLDNTAGAALEASNDKDTYTCYTTMACSDICANAGITYFDDAANLTTTAITTYTCFDGADYYSAAYTIALAESAASISKKHAWTAELDKRTKMPSSKFYRESYEVIGAGHKGICYYEWRGDYPDPNSPLPDNCGFLHYDGTPTETFEKDKKMLSLINRYSTEIVTAEKKRCKIALLHSDRAYMYYDALSDPGIGGKNMWMYLILSAFKELKKSGFAPDFVRSCDLEENPLGIKILFVPSLVGLSDEELRRIRSFAAKKGNKVFFGEQKVTFDAISVGGWWDISNPPKNRTTEEFRGGYEMADLLEIIDVKPMVETNHKNLFAHILEGKKRKIIVLVSNRPDEKSIPEHEIKFNFDVSEVTYITPELEEEVAIEVKNNCVILPELYDGAFMFVK